MKAAGVFEKMAKATSSDVVGKVGAVYRFDIKADGEKRSWLVDLKNGPGKVEEVTGNDEAKGECLIIMKDADFIDLMTGKLDGQTAFMGGQLKVISHHALPRLCINTHTHKHAQIRIRTNWRVPIKDSNTTNENACSYRSKGT